MKGYRRLMRVFFRSEADRERETDEEIQAHIDMRTADLVAQGLPEADARRRALERFGDLDRARKELRNAAVARDRVLTLREHLDAVRRDLLVAWRRAKAAPGHAALSVGIFAMGIGLTTVMFTVLDQVMLRPLPYPESDRLVALRSVTERGDAFSQVSMGNWYDWDRENTTLQSSALVGFPFNMTVSSDADAFSVLSVATAGDFFSTLRPPFVLGRGFTRDEAQDGAMVVVVSEGFWRRVLEAGPVLASRRLTLDDSEYEVVGVLAEGVGYPEEAEIWLPRPARAFTGGARNNINYHAVARLAPGISIEQAESELTGIAHGIRASDPEGVYSWGVGVRSLQSEMVENASTYLKLLMGAVLLVLLIGCANLAALGFARGTERTGEVALRLSLGAGRRRLFQQFMTEHIAYALVGGALGLGAAGWGLGEAMVRLREVVPRADEVTFDLGVVVFALLASLLAGVLAGLAPAQRVSESTPALALLGSRTVKGGLGAAGAVLVGMEVALTVVLLTGGALLLKSFQAVSDRDLGFDPTEVLTARIALSGAEYRDDNERVLEYWRSLLDEVAALPSVESVGVGTWIPTGGGGRGFIELPDDPEPGVGAGYRVVSDDYFAAMRIPVLSGRTFGPEDQFGTERVVLVNETMANRYWPGMDPIGQVVKATSMEGYYHGGTAPWLSVVGVVGDVRHYGLESDAGEEMFVLYRQMPWMATGMTAVVRARPAQMAAAVEAVRDQVRSIDPGLAVTIDSLSERVRLLLSERRLIATVLTTFAGLALLLASFGVYGVISFAVSRRTQEMAIRAALGASGGGLIRLVLAGALRVVAAGAVVGLVLAIGFRGVLDAFLVDVRSSDPWPYLLASLVLVGVTVLAAFVPAWRASRMDPLEALRDG